MPPFDCWTQKRPDDSEKFRHGSQVSCVNEDSDLTDIVFYKYVDYLSVLKINQSMNQSFIIYFQKKRQ